MADRPLVSAIVIFFDAEQFIEEAIESVFAQTYAHWELLLVDDGSRDGSTEIARQFAERFPDRVRYLAHRDHGNRGMSASRNLGIRHAKGELLGFIDADDAWLPHKLEQQVAILTHHPEAAMVYGRARIWHSWSQDPEHAQDDFFYELGVEVDTLVMPPELAIVLLKNRCQTPVPSNALLRRALVERVGAFEESFRAMYEDQVFFAKVELQWPVFVSGECWINYRQHPDSCCGVAEQADYHVNRLPFLYWVRDYLSRQRVEDARVWRVLRIEIWKCRHPKAYRLFGGIRRRLLQTARPLNGLMHS